MPTDKPRGMFHDLVDEEPFFLWHDGNFVRGQDRSAALGEFYICYMFGWNPMPDEQTQEDYLRDLVAAAHRIEAVFPLVLTGYVNFDLEFVGAKTDYGINEPVTEAIQEIQRRLEVTASTYSEWVPDNTHPCWGRLYDWKRLMFRVVLK